MPFAATSGTGTVTSHRFATLPDAASVFSVYMLTCIQLLLSALLMSALLIVGFAHVMYTTCALGNLRNSVTRTRHCVAYFVIVPGTRCRNNHA